MTQYVVIGCGPAGIIAAETLRKHDQKADIKVIGNESEPPYSRMAIPYFLIEKINEQGTYLRKTAGHFEKLNIQIVNGQVVNIMPREGRLVLSDDRSIAYDKLLIATGSSPVKPPIDGMNLPEVLNCWTLSDARKIVELTEPGVEVVLMGAGFIGCIILEALVQSGARLTVVEMGDRMVPRMMNEKAGNLIKRWCIAKGIKVHTGTRITSIDKKPGGQLAIKCDNGTRINCDFLVSATGVQANMDFLAGSGIETDQGILVNRHMQSSIENIYAAGDVAQGLDFSTETNTVQAIQPTASEHAQIAAKNMLGFKQALHQGSINMNILDTLGLISSSFGLWMGTDKGESAELYDPEHFKYINLQFQNDILVGATSLGLTQHIGVLRGLIQGRVKLGNWKARLIKDPSRIMEAYLENRLNLSE